MEDKQLAKILAEMLIKQEETSLAIQETNNILKDFMGVSVKQWDAQQKFNEKFFEKLESIEKVYTHYLF